MLDLITFQGPTEINERSSCQVTVAFRDSQVFADAQPTNVYYRLDDEGGCVLVDWASVTPPALPDNDVVVTLTAEQNRILNEARNAERKTLSVMANRGLATQCVGTYTYAVKNFGWLS